MLLNIDEVMSRDDMSSVCERSAVVGYLIQDYFMTSVKMEMRLPLANRNPRYHIPRVLPELMGSWAALVGRTTRLVPTHRHI